MDCILRRNGWDMMEIKSVSAEPGHRALATKFTVAERKDLVHLRTRYRQGRDFLSGQEYAHMRFVRWLYQTGRIDP
jgi:N-acyl-L-homoserine lactone synthetase